MVGKVAWLRLQGDSVTLYCVLQGRHFAAPGAVGFDAADEVSLVLQGQSGAIVSPGANVTFLVEGRSPAVFIDGAVTEAASRGPGSVTVRVPAGTHRSDIDGS